MSAADKALLACPFCGERAVVEPARPVKNVVLWFAICTRCYVKGRGFADRSKAVTEWNTRTAPPSDTPSTTEPGERGIEALAEALYNAAGHWRDGAWDSPWARHIENGDECLRDLFRAEAERIVDRIHTPTSMVSVPVEPSEAITNGEQYEDDYTLGADKAREIVSWIENGETRNRVYRLVRDALNAAARPDTGGK